MILYYSGSLGDAKNEPEDILRDNANIMLSYWLISVRQQGQHIRFPKVLKARQKNRKGTKK